jgi:hypothetical protein
MDSSSKFKLQLPKLFSYHNQIKNPDEMGASSAGSNAALKRDSDAMFGYVGGIFSGSNNSVFKTGYKWWPSTATATTAPSSSGISS